MNYFQRLIDRFSGAIFFTVISIVLTLIVMLFGCSFTPVFHNSAEAELKILSDQLTNSRLEDLFRQHPTLRLVKSTNIGNGNMRHEFSYTTVEKEDVSQRPNLATTPIYIYERQVTCYINIFVDASGVIYEVLDPVIEAGDVVMTNERWSDRKK